MVGSGPDSPVLFQYVANPEIVYVQGVECPVEMSGQVVRNRLRHASRGVRAAALEVRQEYFRCL